MWSGQVRTIFNLDGHLHRPVSTLAIEKDGHT